MIEKIRKTREYLDYLERHYNNVQKAWTLIKEKCSDMRFITDDFCYFSISDSVKNHDLSKLSKEEFVQYREFFYPIDKKEKEDADIALAFDNHLNHNIHHWQTWTKHVDYPYADIYLVDNIVDWMAMGFEFGDTAKEYYEKNKDKIEMPEWAIILMYKIFDRLYDDRKN